MMRRVKIIVCGRVQGVGYRYFVQEKAKHLGVKGYVRNLPGGEVEIDAEGERNCIVGFILECKKGPSLSIVSDCVVHDVNFYGFGKFVIR